MKPIGPSFPDELAVADLLGQPFSWSDGGQLFFADEATQGLKDAVAVVLHAHDPEKPAKAPVPQVVSRFQGREAMHRTGHGDGTVFDAVEALLSDSATPAMYRRAWNDLQEFRRDSEMLAAIAGMLGLSSAQIDALFILAASIQA